MDATHNDWSGDADPEDKICGTNGADDVTVPCDEGATAGSDVEWDPVAPTGSGGLATSTPTRTNTPTSPTATNTPTGTPPTNTPTRTPTVTGTPPTSTPTRTATPSGMETVTLVGGTCNPVASTYPDNTPIATIAGAVSPSGILISIWWFNASANDWQGYSPQFPSSDISDLTEVDRLEAIFICVSTAGTWSRPLV